MYDWKKSIAQTHANTNKCIHIILIQTLNYVIFKNLFIWILGETSHYHIFFPKKMLCFCHGTPKEAKHTHTRTEVHTRLYIKPATHTYSDTTVKIYKCYYMVVYPYKLHNSCQRCVVTRTALPLTWMCRYYIPTLWKSVVWRTTTTFLAYT